MAMGENADGTMMTPEQLKMQASLMTRAVPEGGQMPILRSKTLET